MVNVVQGDLQPPQLVKYKKWGIVHIELVPSGESVHVLLANFAWLTEQTEAEMLEFVAKGKVLVPSSECPSK